MNKRKTANKGIVIIKKSNQLIEARYKFDVWETRFFLAALSQINKDDEDFRVYRIWYKDLIKNFGLKSNQSYDLLRQAVKSLAGKSFTVSNIVNGRKRETIYHIIRTANYLSPDETNGDLSSHEYVDVTFEPEMKPMLLQLQKNFTTYDLQMVVKLGAYPIRFYELLKQYETFGQRTLEIDSLKKMLEITSEYPLFATFYQRVVAPSVEEINKHTDIFVREVVKIKEGRRVTALKFLYERKQAQPKLASLPADASPSEAPLKSAQPAPAPAPENSEFDRLFDTWFGQVRAFGISASTFAKWLGQYSPAHIESCIRSFLEASESGKIRIKEKSKQGGYLRKLIEEADFSQQIEAEKAREQHRQQAEQEAARKQQLEEIRREAEREKARQARAIADALLEDTPHLLETIAEEMNRKHQRAYTTADYEENPLFRAMVIARLKEIYPDAFEQ